MNDHPKNHAAAQPSSSSEERRQALLAEARRFRTESNQRIKENLRRLNRIANGLPPDW